VETLPLKSSPDDFSDTALDYLVQGLSLNFDVGPPGAGLGTSLKTMVLLW